MIEAWKKCCTVPPHPCPLSFRTGTARYALGEGELYPALWQIEAFLISSSRGTKHSFSPREKAGARPEGLRGKEVFSFKMFMNKLIVKISLKIPLLHHSTTARA